MYHMPCTETDRASRSSPRMPLSMSSLHFLSMSLYFCASTCEPVRVSMHVPSDSKSMVLEANKKSLARNSTMAVTRKARVMAVRMAEASAEKSVTTR